MHHQWQSYDIWFLRYEAWQTEFFVILDHFLPFYSPNNLKNQNFEKLKKPSGDVIILHRHIKNYNHMMYDSWYMECDRMSCHFGPFFCPFTPLTTQKIKSLKKWKKKKQSWRYYHFTCVYHNWQSYDVWFLRYGVKRTKIFVILDHFLHFYTPNNPKNWNFEKIKIKPRDIIILHMCTINGNHMMYGSWDMKHDRQDKIFCPFGLFFVLLLPPAPCPPLPPPPSEKTHSAKEKF